MQAGSRNEEHSNLGLGHALRIAAGLGTKNNSAFGICRNLQQAGASLTCVQGREHTLYTIQATRDATDLAADYLCDVVSNQAFKPWELERNLPRMKLELATKNPAADAVELLHQAAFRSGLGNSLYCAPHKVGSHSTAQLQTFVSKHFTSGRSALLGIGVNHANLAKFGELLNLEAGSGPADVASKYSGGEVLITTVSYLDHFSRIIIYSFFGSLLFTSFRITFTFPISGSQAQSTFSVRHFHFSEHLNFTFPYYYFHFLRPPLSLSP